MKEKNFNKLQCSHKDTNNIEKNRYFYFFRFIIARSKDISFDIPASTLDVKQIPDS